MKNTSEEDRQGIVHIDELNLDKECIRLPSNYLQYATSSAEAKRDCDEFKAELSVMEAELRRKIVEDPAKYGLEKATEKTIEAVILSNAKIQAKEKELRGKVHELALSQAVVSALEHKKRTLTLLVELHGQGYFASPRLSERGREAVVDMTKKKVRHFRDQDEE